MIKPIAIFTYVFLYIPIVVLFLSTTGIGSDISFDSIKNYKEFIFHKEITDAIFFSLKLSFISSSIAVIISIILAMNTNSLLSTIIMIPFFISEVILGFVFLIFFNFLENLVGDYIQINYFSKIIIAHVVLGCSYTVNIIRSSIKTIDPRIYEAALDLGAKKQKIFIDIILPHISKSIFISWIVCFLLSMDDVIISSFLSNKTNNTLSLLIYSKIKVGSYSEISALSSLIILVCVLCALLTSFLIYYFNKKPKKNIIKKNKP